MNVLLNLGGWLASSMAIVCLSNGERLAATFFGIAALLAAICLQMVGAT